MNTQRKKDQKPFIERRRAVHTWPDLARGAVGPPTPVTYSADAGGCDSIAYVKELASSVQPASPSTTHSPLAVGLSITMDN